MVRQATSQYAFATQSSKVEVLTFNSPTYPPPLRGGKHSPKAKTHSLEFKSRFSNFIVTSTTNFTQEEH